MKKEQQKQIALNRINLLLNNALTQKSNLYFQFANDYVFEYPEPITNLDIIKCGYRVKEVAVNMKEREFGVSSINFKKSIYYMLNVGLAMLILGIGGSKK